MSDATLGDNGEVCPELIPFDQSFLPEDQELRAGHKPRNWVTNSGYDQARERLLVATAQRSLS